MSKRVLSVWSIKPKKIMENVERAKTFVKRFGGNCDDSKSVQLVNSVDLLKRDIKPQ